MPKQQHSSDDRSTPRPTQIVATVARGDTKELRVTLGGLSDRPLASVREWYLSDGEWLPGRSGIALKLGEVVAIARALDKLAEDLDLDVEGSDE